MSLVGRLFYQYFYQPIVTPVKYGGGLSGYLQFVYGKSQMKRASKKLRVPVFDRLNNRTTIVGIAGKGNWYQMAFCLYSFYTQLEFNLNTVIIDDGTMDDELQAEIKNQIPFLTIIPHNEAHLRAKGFFSKEKYPLIADTFDKFVVFKKLFHARSLIKGPVLVLDADMLFYKEPTELIKWIDQGENPVYIYDKYSYYGGQTDKLLRDFPIKLNVNTGIIGLNNDDFDALERLTKLYLETNTLNYLMEQALYAMYIIPTNAHHLAADDYEILPSKNEAISPKGIMLHFPTENRQFYFRYAWRNIVIQ